MYCGGNESFGNSIVDVEILEDGSELVEVGFLVGSQSAHWENLLHSSPVE